MNRIKTKWRILILLLIILIGVAVYPVPPQLPIKYVDRDSRQIKIEKVYGEEWLNWLYHNPIGEASLWAIANANL